MFAFVHTSGKYRLSCFLRMGGEGRAVLRDSILASQRDDKEVSTA